MSLIKDLESFAHKFETDLEKLWSKAPAIEKIAETTITFVGPILEDIFVVAGDGPAAALVGAVISKAQQDLTAANALITTIGPTLSVAGLINGVVTDLSGLETAAHIVDTKTVSNINLVVKELQALVGAFPEQPPVVSPNPPVQA